MGKDAQMHYQITLCRINDMLYKPHTSDSMMLKVADYFEKRNNKVLLSQAYYCLGGIYRDLNNHPKAINYFLKAATTDSINAPKEMYNRENDLYNFSKRNVHFSPFFRGSSSSLEYHLKGF